MGRRDRGSGTVRKRSDGRWEGRVLVGYDEKGLPKTKNVLEIGRHIKRPHYSKNHTFIIGF